MPTEAQTLIDALTRAARTEPERGIALFEGRGRHAERRTFPEVLDAVRLSASRLRSAGLEPGDRVLVALPTCWEWVEAWLGAMVSGAVPAALAPPAALGSDETYLPRVASLRRRTDARLVVARSALREEARSRGENALAESIMTPDELASFPGDPGFPPHAARPEDVAFLQFTSGSTGLSRAVMISHAAALHNTRACDEAIGEPFGAPVRRWVDGMAAWLPLHHDMGLIGCFFFSIVLSHELRLFNPQSFLARPQLWLRELASLGASYAPLPNFGYQLCVERLVADDLRDVDLSRWRSAMTGAEMVRTDTLDAFCELTRATGFRRETICPCYGLAEATVAVTLDRRGLGARTRPVPPGAGDDLGLSEVVSVGSPMRETQLRICSPNGERLADGAVGEVRVKGPGLFSGYYDDPEATAQALHDGWLLTGDLGFLHDGELYLTGRLKDILIIRGNNLMPHELEWHAEAVAGGGGSLRSGAFSIARGREGEEPVLVVESTETAPGRLAAMEREIRNRIGRALSLPLADLLFVRRGRLPKTTSGKVRRRELKRMYLDSELERLDVTEVNSHG